MKGMQRPRMFLFYLALAVAVAVQTAFVWANIAPTRPAPSGPHGVGQRELSLTGSDGTAIAVTIWYPSDAIAKGERAFDAPLSAPSLAPLILYSPGWGRDRQTSSIQIENLASRGFVVAACDDVASGASGALAAGFDLSSDEAAAASIARADRHVAAQAARLREILGALASDQAGDFAGRLDLSRIGVLGYSVGGAAGAQAALEDPNIAAVFNLDGWLFARAASETGPGDYFLLSTNSAFPPRADLASSNPNKRNTAIFSARDQARNWALTRRTGSYWIVVGGVDHGGLSDDLFAPSAFRNLLRTNSQRHDINLAIEAYEAAFFEHALLGRESALLQGRRLFNSHVRWINSISPANPETASAPT